MIDEDDRVIALANGVPPSWVEDIPGTETWAFYQAASRAEPGSTFMVDCEPCVLAVHKGAVAATSDKNPLARVHGLMMHALDDIPPEAVIWTPSHVGENGVGKEIRGDGFLLQSIDVHMNDVADRYAKRAVEAHRVPYRIRKEIEAHDEITTANAMWIARATVLANQQETIPMRDTQASRARAAAAARERTKQKVQQAGTVTTPGTNPQTGKPTTIEQRLPGDGGHMLEKCDRGWCCLTCKAKSATWARLAPQTFSGMAEQRWADVAMQRTENNQGSKRRHMVVVSPPSLGVLHAGHTLNRHQCC